jgi:hypothetical protein
MALLRPFSIHAHPRRPRRGSTPARVRTAGRTTLLHFPQVIAVQIPRAYLRVLEPLAAFPSCERARWTAYVDAGNAPPWHLLAEWEERAAFARALGLYDGAAIDHTRHAYVERDHRSVFICPLDLDLRTLYALSALRRSLPEEVVETLLAPRELEHVLRALARVDDEPVPPRCHIKQSSWAIPLPWFALFDDRERRLSAGTAGTAGTAGGDGRPGPPRLVYATTMDKARERLLRALAALEALGSVVEFAMLAEELCDWLSGFDDSSVVNLDYGGLACVIPLGDLDSDHTAREVWEALAALEAGDLERSDELYTSISERWAELRGREARN